MLPFLGTFLSAFAGDVSLGAEAEPAPRPQLFLQIAIPEEYLVTEGGRRFGGDLRIGDLDGDGHCDFLVYRSGHGGPSGPAIGGFKPCFLGAFDMDGTPLCYWNGPDRAALLYNGGWLWDLKTGQGGPIPDLPAPNGAGVHRMGFHHAIAADLCGDSGEELVLWNPTATEVFIYARETPGEGTSPLIPSRAQAIQSPHHGLKRLPPDQIFHRRLLAGSRRLAGLRVPYRLLASAHEGNPFGGPVPAAHDNFLCGAVSRQGRPTARSDRHCR